MPASIQTKLATTRKGQTMTISAAELQAWTGRLLEAWGYSPSDAGYLAETLTDANLRGVDSHGVIRLPAYQKRIEAGLVDPTAAPRVEVDGAIIRVDAAGAAGQLAARAAVDALVDRSAELGVATAGVRGSTHFGTAGYYARALARRGKVAIVVSNSEPIVVPFGGRDALLGTNPFAFAAPTTGEPVSLDMATSTSAMGKVFVARSNQTPIPADWGVDANGVPTTDPDAVAALLPAGGPKGYGLAFLVEILAGVLTGAAVAGDIGNMYSDFTRPQDVGHWMLAIDIERFQPMPSFVSRLDALIDVAHAVAPAPGHGRVLVPGEPEEITRTACGAAGIDIAESTVAELVDVGIAAGVPFPGVNG